MKDREILEAQNESLRKQSQMLEMKAILLGMVAEDKLELKDDIIGMYGRAKGGEGVVMSHDERYGYALKCIDGKTVRFASMMSFHPKVPPNKYAERAAILKRDALSRYVFEKKDYEVEFKKQMALIRPKEREGIERS